MRVTSWRAFGSVRGGRHAGPRWVDTVKATADCKPLRATRAMCYAEDLESRLLLAADAVDLSGLLPAVPAPLTGGEIKLHHNNLVVASVAATAA